MLRKKLFNGLKKLIVDSIAKSIEMNLSTNKLSEPEIIDAEIIDAEIVEEEQPRVVNIKDITDPMEVETWQRVSMIVEAAMSKIVWKPRIRDGEEEMDGDDVTAEIYVQQMIPVFIADGRTYTLMVKIAEKSTNIEQNVLSLSQFLANFIPVEEIHFEQYDS